MFFDIKSFEKKYKKELENIEEWNYLRNYYREISQSVNNKKNISLLKSLKDAFYCVFAWVRRYDYIFFSNNERKKLSDGLFYDIRIDYIIKQIGMKNSLIVETPKNGHINKRLIPIKNIVSRRFIDLLTIFGEKIFKKKYSIDFLELIHRKYDIKYNYNAQINRFNIQYKIYKFWFKLIKPKYIFLVCYYDKQYIIKAAHNLGIKVIEIQHGLISKSHMAYYSNLSLNRSYLPDYLLSFGRNLKEEKNNEFIFFQENIFPIGNYYLDALKKKFQKNRKLCNIKSKYKSTVGISLQWTVENELISFVKKVSSSLPDILFILIPRDWDENKNKCLNLPDNIIFYPSLDCYQVIMHCHYHCTVYSSCALEAPTLGIPNILVNLNGFSKKYIYNMLNNDNTYIVNTEQEFIEKMKQEYSFEKDKVIKSNEKNFVNNYIDNIERIIDNFTKK